MDEFVKLLDAFQEAAQAPITDPHSGAVVDKEAEAALAKARQALIDWAEEANMAVVGMENAHHG
jgi:hypothetical protein